MDIGRIRDRFDRAQRSHAWLGFPIAVLKRFGEHRGGQHAALIAFYGFFSLFPLLLVAVTILGFVLRDDPALQERLVGSALSAFPIIGEQIRDNIGALTGSGPALAIGLAGATWAGLGGINAVQGAMNEIWDVPPARRPGRVRRTARGLVMLGVLGLLISGAAAASAFGAAGAAGLGRVGAFAASFVIDVIAFTLAFRILTARDSPWKQLLPGALVGGVAWLALQAGGAALVGSRLRGASPTYGFFAVVIGLLSWMLLTAQVLLIAAEINGVKARRLWPRSLGGSPTAADGEVLALQKRVLPAQPPA